MRKHRIGKMLITMALMITMVWMIPMGAEASTELPIQPRYTNTRSAVVGLNNDNGTAVCVGDVVGYDGTTIYLVEMVLEQLSSAGMTTMRIPWTGMSSTTNYITVVKRVGVPTGFNYRLTLTAVVRSSTLDETVSVSTEKQF